MLLADFSTVPGFGDIGEVTHCGSKVFQSAEDPSIRLTVIMANRLPLEQQTGADLIYFNEAYQSFVMVQYKAMEKGSDQAEFRWQAGDQFVQEIERMDVLLAELNEIQSGSDPDGYRFSENPFFLKFCPRVVFNPDDKGLFKGIYLPLELWKRSNAAGRLKGSKGGSLLTFQNVGRRINKVPLRDRCSFGRFPWLISQALSVTYMAGERRLYLERNCRLPESPAHSRRRNREGPASSKGLNSQRGFGPAVEPRRKSRPRSTSLHGSSPCKCQRLSTLRWDRLPPSRPSTKSGARAGGRRLSDRRLHRWLAGTSASAPSSHGAADLLGLNRAHICVRNHQ